MIYGYVRPSSIDDTEKSISVLRTAGVYVENIFVEEPTMDLRRLPKLQELLERLVEGDATYVTSLSQLSRTADGIVSAMLRVYETGADIVSLGEGLDTRTMDGSRMFEFAMILNMARRRGDRERRADSMAKARTERRRVWGQDPVDAESLDRAVALYMGRSATVKEIAAVTGVSSSTLYRELARRGLKRD